jgi:uncharacterized membrane protein
MSALKEMPGAEVLPRSTAASTLLDGRYLPPPKDGDGKRWVRTSVLIQREPGDLYALWRNLEDAPLWQEEVTEVVETSLTISHWTMRSGDKTMEWDAEILNDEPGKRIAWKSIAGDIDEAGEVIFEPAPGERGTLVTVLMEFHIGRLAIAWETFMHRNPKQTVIENLRHFKALAETGEIPRSQNASHADRGMIGETKRSMYGEKIPTPAGKI